MNPLILIQGLKSKLAHVQSVTCHTHPTDQLQTWHMSKKVLHNAASAIYASG